MAQPINLNKRRKLRKREADRQQADINAVKFGRTKAARDVEAKAEARRKVFLDQTKREPE